MKQRSIFILLTLLNLTALKAEISFTQHNLTTSFTKATTVDVFDADNDGDKDIFGGAYGSGEISWWENSGSQNFLTKHLLKSGLKSVRHLRVADLDGDNQPDLAVTQFDSSRVTIFYSINQNPATEIVLDANLIGAHTIDIVDFDHDSDLDLLISTSNISDNGSGEIVWYQNNGNRNYTRQSLWQQYKQVTFVEAVDINNDNHFDLLTCDESSGKVAYLLNSGNNLTFTEQIVDNSFSFAHTFLARDLDRDGDLDILGAACQSSQIAWWENSGNFNFSRHSLGTVNGALWLEMADFDLDGDNDLIAGGMTTYFPSWLKNNGSQNFTKIDLGTGNPFTGTFQIIPADLDNDGDFDLVGAAWYGNKIAWWDNNAVTGIEDDKLKKDTGLLESYPNPFNPQTTLSFTLEQDQFVQLDVYNVRGELVANLNKGILTAGQHSINFDASHLESGIYFCRLTSPQKVFSRKITLLK